MTITFKISVQYMSLSDTNLCDVITFKFFMVIKIKGQNFHLLKLIMALMFQCY